MTSAARASQRTRIAPPKIDRDLEALFRDLAQVLRDVKRGESHRVIGVGLIDGMNRTQFIEFAEDCLKGRPSLTSPRLRQVEGESV